MNSDKKIDKFIDYNVVNIFTIIKKYTQILNQGIELYLISVKMNLQVLGK